MRDLVNTLSWALLLTAASCATTLTAAQRSDLRQQLRNAMQEPVTSLEDRERHSRLLADIVGKDALQGMNEPDVRAAFGRGDSCTLPVCAQHGFTADDWVYTIGHNEDPKIKQLPLLIIGFDPQRRATRIWTLTTH
jgi:hypothetical protein